MAPRPVAPGVAKFTWTFLCSGRNYTDSFYVSKATEVAWTAGEMDAASAALFAAWVSNIATITSSSCSLVRATVLDLSDDEGRQSVQEATHAGGVTASPPLPLNAVARITFRVPRRYRGGKPAINISGRTQAELADERVFNDADADVILNAVTDTITAILAECPGGSFQCAVSYILHGALRVAPLVLPVVGAEIQKRLCTLRKRLGKGVAELFG